MPREGVARHQVEKRTQLNRKRKEGTGLSLLLDTMERKDLEKACTRELASTECHVSSMDHYGETDTCISRGSCSAERLDCTSPLDSSPLCSSSSFSFAGFPNSPPSVSAGELEKCPPRCRDPCDGAHTTAEEDAAFSPATPRVGPGTRWMREAREPHAMHQRIHHHETEDRNGATRWKPQVQNEPSPISKVVAARVEKEEDDLTLGEVLGLPLPYSPSLSRGHEGERGSEATGVLRTDPVNAVGRMVDPTPISWRTTPAPSRTHWGSNDEEKDPIESLKRPPIWTTTRRTTMESEREAETTSPWNTIAARGKRHDEEGMGNPCVCSPFPLPLSPSLRTSGVRRKTLVQSQLDFGQPEASRLGMWCPHCRLLYSPQVEEDVRLHQRVCRHAAEEGRPRRGTRGQRGRERTTMECFRAPSSIRSGMGEGYRKEEKVHGPRVESPARFLPVKRKREAMQEAPHLFSHVGRDTRPFGMPLYRAQRAAAELLSLAMDSSCTSSSVVRSRSSTRKASSSSSSGASPFLFSVQFLRQERVVHPHGAPCGAATQLWVSLFAVRYRGWLVLLEKAPELAAALVEVDTPRGSEYTCGTSPEVSSSTPRTATAPTPPPVRGKEEDTIGDTEEEGKEVPWRGGWKPPHHHHPERERGRRMAEDTTRSPNEERQTGIKRRMAFGEEEKECLLVCGVGTREEASGGGNAIAFPFLSSPWTSVVSSSSSPLRETSSQIPPPPPPTSSASRSVVSDTISPSGTFLFPGPTARPSTSFPPSLFSSMMKTTPRERKGTRTGKKKKGVVLPTVALGSSSPVLLCAVQGKACTRLQEPFFQMDPVTHQCVLCRPRTLGDVDRIWLLPSSCWPSSELLPVSSSSLDRFFSSFASSSTPKMSLEEKKPMNGPALFPQKGEDDTPVLQKSQRISKEDERLDSFSSASGSKTSSLCASEKSTREASVSAILFLGSSGFLQDTASVGEGNEEMERLLPPTGRKPLLGPSSEEAHTASERDDAAGERKEERSTIAVERREGDDQWKDATGDTSSSSSRMTEPIRIEQQGESTERHLHEKEVQAVLWAVLQGWCQHLIYGFFLSSQSLVSYSVHLLSSRRTAFSPHLEVPLRATVECFLQKWVGSMEAQGTTTSNAIIDAPTGSGNGKDRGKETSRHNQKEQENTSEEWIRNQVLEWTPFIHEEDEEDTP